MTSDDYDGRPFAMTTRDDNDVIAVYRRTVERHGELVTRYYVVTRTGNGRYVIRQDYDPDCGSSASNRVVTTEQGVVIELRRLGVQPLPGHAFQGASL